MTRYRTIVCDPPWDFPEGFATCSHTRGKWKGPTRHYDLPYASMTVPEITALPVRVLAQPDARLFLWTTNRHLPFAFGVVAAWGFTYKQTLTWKKLDGIGGSIAPNSEFLLVATRGAPGLLRRLPNAVIERSQTKTHSAKPEVFLDLIESVSPGPYLEMFSRRARFGWDTHGDQSLGQVVA